MGAFLRFSEKEPGAADNHFVAVIDECREDFLEVKGFRAAVNESHVVDAERGLHLSHLIELVEHHIGVGVALELDDNAHSLVVALVVDIGDTVELLFANQVGDIGYKFGFVYIVGNLGYDNVLMIVLHLDFGTGTDHDSAAAGLICFLHAVVAVDRTSGREVGSDHIFHQLRDGEIGVIHKSHAGVDRLRQVVGRHIRGHTYGNTRSAVYEQIREACG